MLGRLSPPYQQALETIGRLAAVVESPDEGLQAAVDVLARSFAHYSWVGIYLLEGDTLVLGPWRGPVPTEHTRIPLGVGVCGAAAALRRTEVVPDVSKDARYLECFASTKSEIVVPIVDEREVCGEIDVDSDRLDAFGEADVVFLERVAQLITPLARAALRLIEG
ncbi:MAG: GAF domain-containing protein [Chloroflexi bacterium]|nr:GAF domain-containing protein [Chloroflexota bacterium]